MDFTKHIQVLNSAADEAGKILTEHYNTDFEIGRKKDYNDLVTEIDKKSEKKIIEVIHSVFPEHNILGEESGNLNKSSDFVWIVDPIDGTINYAHALPIFCVSIALEYKKEIVLGTVYNPLSSERFFAEKGSGSFLNGKKINVSNTEFLRDSLLVTGFPYGAQTESRIEQFVNFVKMGLPVRRLGSAALDICWLACGRFDGFWEANLNAWDVAAAYLILTEAGGKVTDYSGNKYSVYDKQILATNGKIHDEMITSLRGVTAVSA